jgi:membrane fusion protein (multidrug efflux system)
LDDAPHPLDRVRPASAPPLSRGDTAPSRPRPEKNGKRDEPPQRARGETAAEDTEDPAKERRRHRIRLVAFAAFGALLLAAGIGYGWYWYTTGRFFESTDDAYTEADSTAISPQVAGTIAALLVTDNQQVRQGDLLLRIDDRPFQAAVDQAKADVASAEAQIASLSAQRNLQLSQIQQAEADVASAQANLTYAEQNNARYAALVRTGAGTRQAAQQAEASLRTQQAALQHSQAVLAAARKQLDVLTTQQAAAQATLERNQATLETAQINLGYTTIRAPIAGAIGDRSARPGLYVQPGTQLMTIVPMRRDVYVVANFKETQLSDMYRGQRVTMSIDAFPGATLHGTVDSLAPGSGAEFSLLPPENATGNFTKIVQRVPVKIILDPHDPVLDRLRPGLSVIVDVDTRTTPPGKRATLVAERAR